MKKIYSYFILALLLLFTSQTKVQADETIYHRGVHPCSELFTRFSDVWKECMGYVYPTGPDSPGEHGSFNKGGGGTSAPQDVGPAIENVVKQASENNSDPKQCTNNPVVLATGEKYKEELDFQSRSRYGLSLVRTYRSNHALGRMFGPNWLTNFDTSRITPSGPCVITAEDGTCVRQTAILTTPNGVMYRYTYKQTFASAAAITATTATTAKASKAAEAK
jgi:hypothetical protein